MEENTPEIIDNDDGTKTIKLSEPITIAGQEIATVTMHKPFGRDMRAMDQEKGEIAKSFKLASSVSKLPMAAFDAMTIEDATACIRVADSWSSKS